jgi:hypothetical protein
MTPFCNPNFEQMLNALAEETKDIPHKEIMRKLLKLQFERDVAINFGDNFCHSTGDITELVTGFHQFKQFVGEA